MNRTDLIRHFQNVANTPSVGSILDVGSLDVTGTSSHRHLWPGWTFVGLDIQEGKNVDWVALSPSEWPDSESFDLVTCLSVLEHTDFPLSIMLRIRAVLKHGGFVLCSAPWSFQYHAHPIDAWRLSPDAFNVIAKQTGLNVIECKTVYQHGPTVGAISDIAHLCKRRRWREIPGILKGWWTRPPNIETCFIGQKP